MLRWLHSQQIRRQKARKSPPKKLLLEVLEDRCVPATTFSSGAGYVQTNLVSDLAGMATIQDPNLVNPWGLTASASSPFWISDNGPGLASIFDGAGNSLLSPVTIPGGNPTGVVANPNPAGFDVTANGVTGPAAFIFASEGGSISGWNFAVGQTFEPASDSAVTEVTTAHADYTGLAIGADSTGRTLLYAANFNSGNIDVFDNAFHAVNNLAAGAFQDPRLPAHYVPFNIQNINGLLYVEYTLVDPVNGQQFGAGKGFVDVFNGNGTLMQRISSNKLDAPWGVALAPSNFGQYSNDLLVGNFGDGHINVFNPNSGHFIAQLQVSPGTAFQEDDLWALRFGNGSNSANANTLYFTAGIQDENHGLFGSIQAIPSIKSNAGIVNNLSAAPEQIIPTNSPSGDTNPYGVAFVPQGFKGQGVLQPGDILVSNFNSNSGLQGTGTTIMRITPDGQQSVFFQGTAPLGLTTALGVLKAGFVVVGNVPNTGTSTTPNVGQGSLLLIDASGHLVDTLSDAGKLDGPWDLTINDQGNHGQVFVSNVLSGTVTRIDFTIPKTGAPILKLTQIASGYSTVPAIPVNPALVIGPTGLAYNSASHTLYVASTNDNEIFAIANADTRKTDAGVGKVVVQDQTHLHGPLGLVLAPNGDLIASNGDAVNATADVNEIVEFAPTHHNGQFQFVAEMPVDTSGTPGGAFGIALSDDGGELRFAAVDDNTSTVDVWTFATPGNTAFSGKGALSLARIKH